MRMTLGYRGTHYAGWATQPGERTVQASVESALGVALGQAVRVTAAGRTDAGVHADGQVVSFDTASPIPSEGLQQVLPHHLPDDVWVDDVAEAASDFDARRSARRRWYRYAIWRHRVPSSRWRGRALVTHDPLDVAAMREATRALLGRHDFASLVTSPSVIGSTERTVFAADWLEVSPSLLTFEICADAFLKQMVRAIVGTLLWVGAGRWSPTDFARALAAVDRRAAGPNAPAIGLTLHRIEY
ncbi:MAG TPA: tRNA pseudouridine(38-40) synthase TruA [Chloroflexota bacterium]|nr:tRNA pseudouridine(38-40) synthase TruA [Chloroflexota bacterium]